MKINKKDDKTMFKNLQCGDVFETCDEVYMKISTIDIEETRTNCVNLETGELCIAEPKSDVRKLECVLEEK